jgi:hypothetical protein
MTMLATKAMTARTQNVISGIRAVVELGEWVRGVRTVAPDLSFLHRKLTASAIAANRDDLQRWAAMFSESLANYQELLEMSPAEWVGMSEADLVRLEGMLRQATSGIVLWV